MAASSFASLFNFRYQTVRESIVTEVFVSDEQGAQR